MSRPLRLLAIPALFALAGACSTEKAAPSPAPAPAPTSAKAKPAVTPIDASAVPDAWRADIGGLPHNVGSSLAFIKTMLDTQGATMEQVVCHCCGKSLAKCYTDTATKAAKACSPL